MIKNSFFITKIIFLFALTIQLSAQIKLKELPRENNPLLFSSFLIESSTRATKELNSGWMLYQSEEKLNGVSVNIPFNFSGTDNIICEKEISFTQEQLANKKPSLLFMGINYSADILFNDVVLYKHPGGEIPFQVDIPREIIQTETSNLLVIKINFEPAYDRTIPLSKGWLMPINTGGITRDIFLNFEPLINIEKNNIDYAFADNSVNGKNSVIILNTNIADEENSQQYFLKMNIIDANKVVVGSASKNFISKDYSTTVELNFNFANVKFWTAENPYLYSVQTEIFKADSLIDVYTEKTAFRNENFTGDEFNIDGNAYSLTGTVYYQNNEKTGNLAGYSKLFKDLTQIKNSGFNAVRFGKQAPNPYALMICDQIGLWSIIEIPINSLPESIADEKIFKETANSFASRFSEYFSQFPSVIAIGVGTSYLPNSSIHKNFVQEIAGKIIKKDNQKIFASFIGFPEEKYTGIDLYGLEFFGKKIDKFVEEYKRVQSILDPKNIFISSATYPIFAGQTNGYSNEFSFEAQAKYFEDLIKFADESKSSMLFIDSFFDYEGESASLYTSFNKNNIYEIGVVPSDGVSNRLAERIIQKKIVNGKDTPIPIGSKKDSSPVFFIIIGLILSIITGLLINSKRKLREDASRALLRPYNFFADIRDHRILSGIHSNLLMILLAGSHALLIANLLFFLKNNILLEKIVSSFGLNWLNNLVSFLAWNPLEAFVYVIVFSIFCVFVLTFIIKLSSLLIRNIVYLSSIYFIVIWSFLPLALMLPVEIILYRILVAELVNYYIYIFLALMFLWQIQRLLKGVYVIFDVHPWKVYFFGFIIVILIAGGLTAYFQFTEGTVFYIINSIKQYKLIVG